MKIILSLFLISNLNAQALSSLSSISESINDIQAINKGVLTSPPGLLCIINPTIGPGQYPAKINELYQSCAIDLCGKPKDNVSFYTTDDSYFKFLNEQALSRINKVSPMINDVVTKVIQDNKKAHNEIQKFIQGLEKSYKALDVDEKKFLNSKIFSPYITVNISNSGPLADRVKVEANAPSWADNNFKNALNNYAENERAQTFYNNESMEKLQLTDSEYLTHLNNLISKIDNALKINPSVNDNYITNSIIDIKKSISKPSIDRQSVVLAFSSASIISQEIESKDIAVTGGSLCDNSECQKARQSFFKSAEFQKPWGIYSKSLSDPKFYSQSQNLCKAGIVSSEIEESDIMKAIEVYNSAVKLIKSNYLTKFSDKSRKLIEKYLDESVIPSNHNTSQLKPKVDYISRFSEEASQFIKSESFALSTREIIDSAFMIKNNPDALQLSGISIHPCQTYSNTVWDAFLSVEKVNSNPSKYTKEYPYDLQNKDRIFISPFSCQHADKGIHNIAHEIGHALNNFLITKKISQASKKTFTTLRTCAAQNYSDLPKLDTNSFVMNGDTLLTEEDTADLVANIALGDKKIYACYFLKPSLVNDTYLDLSFESSFSDNHSSGFSRILHEAINKEVEFPKSCKDLIQVVKPEMNFKKCI